jgi:hypothetical protein
LLNGLSTSMRRTSSGPGLRYNVLAMPLGVAFCCFVVLVLHLSQCVHMCVCVCVCCVCFATPMGVDFLADSIHLSNRALKWPPLPKPFSCTLLNFV